MNNDIILKNKNRSIILTLLVSNFVIRIPIYIFKYIGVFYFVKLFSKGDDFTDLMSGKHAYGWIWGGAYLLPIVWSKKITKSRHQTNAVWLGAFLLFFAFLSLAIGSFWLLSGVLFAIGFGLVNSNFKAFFGKIVKEFDTNNELPFTFLMLSTNMAAVCAAFVFPSSEMMKSIFLIGAIVMILFLFIWKWILSKLKSEISSREDIPEVANQNVRAIQHFPRGRLLVVLLVITLATLFWVIFELRSNTLNLFARNRLCLQSWGVSLAPSYLQSVNPFFYVLLTPVFVLFLKILNKNGINIHPFRFMGFGIGILGIGLLIFCSQTVGLQSNECISANVFILLYVIQTFGELFLEPIGLEFINRNSPTHLASVMFVLWESNSGLAYIISSYKEIDDLVSLGWIAAISGFVFAMLSNFLKRFVI